MFIDMTARKPSTFRIDERVLEAVVQAAKKANLGKNRFIENLLIEYCQRSGFLPEDFEPLGENRGGKRDKKDN